MISITETRIRTATAIHEQMIGGSSPVEEFAIDLLSTVSPTLSCWVKNDIGRESTGKTVIGRDITEDVEIKIDDLSEKFLVKTANQLTRKRQLSFSVLSEHNNFDIGQKGPSPFTLVLDPFENSDEYKRRLPTPPFTHFQIYDRQNEPIVAGASNLATGQIYFAADRSSSNYYFHPELKKLVKMSNPRQVKSITDGDVAIASYDGKFKYISVFDRYFSLLKKDLEKNGGSFHGKGGSHSYIDLATGAISAYIMFNEPRGEIDAAYLFAKLAGCKVVSVSLEDGTYQDYQFDPALQHDRVRFLIAASSEELIKEIISYYKNSPSPQERV